MKRTFILALLLFSATTFAYADGPFGYSLFETTDEARARHSANNYQTYQNQINNNQIPPLNGYSSNKLGDPQPTGTWQPGYVNNGLNGNNYNRGLNSRY